MSCEKGNKDNINEKSFSISFEHSFDISDYNEIHKHNMVEVIYVLGGEVDLIIDFAPCKIKKGDSILINSNIYHAILSSDKSDFEFLTWSFLPEYIYAYGKDIYNIELFLWFAIKERNTFSVINTCDVPEIKELFLAANNRFLKKEYGFELELHADSLNLCRYFFSKWHEKNSAYVREISRVSISKIKEVLIDIEEKCENLSFAELDKAFNIKNVTFSKNFKSVTGYNVSEYIEFCRIRKAMFLLLTTTLPVTNVATSVGYFTPAYFSKKFREFNKMSPSEFRKLNKVKAESEVAEEKKEQKCFELKEQTQNRLYYDSILASVFYERFIPDIYRRASFFDIYYIDKGYLDIKFRDKLYNLKEGDMFIACPEEEIQLLSDETLKKGVFIIEFYPEFLKFGKDDNELSNDFIYYTKHFERLFSVDENDTEILEALKQINLARIERNINFELTMRGGFTKIVAWILKKQYEKAGAALLANDDHVSDNVKKVLEYIDEHYMEKLSLKKIAEKFFINYSYLSRTLKRITGESFNIYIQKKKLLKATFLLITTDEPVSEISKKLGYCSQGYFTEQFTRREKMTPSEFRRRFKNKIPFTDAYRYEYYEY